MIRRAIEPRLGRRTRGKSREKPGVRRRRDLSGVKHGRVTGPLAVPGDVSLQALHERVGGKRGHDEPL